MSALIAAFVTGLLTALLLPRLLSRLASRHNGHHSAPADIYSLSHALLNVPLPPETLWINMGFWRDTTDFPTACRSLLLHLLSHTDLLSAGASPRTVKIWDIGVGCGDQTLLLHDTLTAAGITLEYEGVTLNPAQFRVAGERTRGLKGVAMTLGDAADSAVWPRWSEDVQGEERWTLALDSLYHVTPDRTRVLRHAGVVLGSGLMAFDLLLSDDVTLLQRLMMRVVCALMRVPYENFLTRGEYCEMLCRCGYESGRVQVVDVSADVFKGLSGFLERRGGEWREVGVGGKAWMGFRVVGWVVGWWARTGVVRGCVVVARK